MLWHTSRLLHCTSPFYKHEGISLLYFLDKLVELPKAIITKFWHLSYSWDSLESLTLRIFHTDLPTIPHLLLRFSYLDTSTHGDLCLWIPSLVSCDSVFACLSPKYRVQWFALQLSSYTEYRKIFDFLVCWTLYLLDGVEAFRLLICRIETNKAVTFPLIILQIRPFTLLKISLNMYSNFQTGL